MMKNYVLDAYAWIEYSLGSKMGQFVDAILKKTNCFTPSIVIAELSDKFHRELKQTEWELFYRYIKNRSTVIPLDEVLANQSGKQKQILRSKKVKDIDMKQIGLVDAIIYQTTLNLEAQLVTGDEHFRGVEGVIYLKNAKLVMSEEEKLRNKD